ncbi:MAG: molybdate ABC transporter substrate-binding protein [Chloroflexota bacterium]
MPAEITLLSAGAVKPGLVKVVDAFRRASRHEVKLEFATAPVIVKRLGAGEMVDLVIAPPAILDELAALGKIFPTQAVIGRIGVGVMVRDSTPLPRIATVDDFKQSLLKARSLVYNRASTGIYLETLFDRLGIAAALKSKSTRYPDFAAVLEHVKKGNQGEIGLGATTVIIECQSQGVKFVGPLPAAIQNYTIYSAAVTSMGEAKGAARELLRHLTSAATEDMFAAAGITGRE